MYLSLLKYYQKVFIFCVTTLMATPIGAVVDLASDYCQHHDAFSSFTQKHYLAEVYCEDQTLHKVQVFMLKYNSLLMESLYNDQGQLVERRSYNREGKATRWSGRTWLSDTRFIEESYHVRLVSKMVTGKSLYQIDEQQKRRLLQRWFFRSVGTKDEPDYVLERIDHYNENKQISKRELVGSRYGYNGYLFEFIQPKEVNNFGWIDGFVIKDPTDQIVGRYRVEVGDPLALIEQSVRGNKEKLNLFRSKRRQVAIIDTGFSYSHPDIAHKLFVNERDPLDGLDNDGNGIVDDTFGFYVYDDGTFSSNIQERTLITNRGILPIPFSHGTHVTSLALKDVSSFAWNGFGGDMSNITYLNKLNDRLQNSAIEFINMSFGFGDPKNPMAPNGDAFNTLSKLIEDNSKILFFAAAGNSGLNIDNGLGEYPASFEFDNILTVGALSTHEIAWDRPLADQHLEVVSFSNTGPMSVDIFAPGHWVVGANVGQMTVPVSGTSMASPVTMNAALKVAEEFPKLSGAHVKNILLYSAYIPDLDRPLPCRSGGIVDEERAKVMAQTIATSLSKGLAIGRAAYVKAALAARATLSREGESLSPDYVLRLKEQWLNI